MMKGARVVAPFGEVITGKGHNFWMLVINLLFLDLGGFMGVYVIKIHYKFSKLYVYHLDSFFV